jgi:hypothetical protein
LTALILSRGITVLYGSVASNPKSSVYLQILLIVVVIHLYCLCIVEKGYFQSVLVSTLQREIEFVNSKLIVHVDSKLLYFYFLLYPAVVERTLDTCDPGIILLNFGLRTVDSCAEAHIRLFNLPSCPVSFWALLKQHNNI